MKIAMSLLSGIGYGGVTYFSNLLPELARFDQKNEYHFFVPKKHTLPAQVRGENIFFHECIDENPSAIKRFFWEQCVFPFLLSRLNIDVVYTAKNMNIFFAPCVRIIAMRNMEPFRYRRYPQSWRRWALNTIKFWLSRLSIWRANGIVCVSKAVCDATRIYHNMQTKTAIIYNGNPVKNTGDRTAQRTPFLLTASKFISYAQQIELLHGYAALKKRLPSVPPLWFAGGVHDARYFAKVQRTVTDLGIQDSTRFLGLIPQERLFSLYRNATVFVFPSTLESCPHTLIEAMACGAPIATTRVAPMPEICGDAALYFDVYRPDDIAEKIALLLEDTEHARTLAERGVDRASAFTWERTAKELIAFFTTVA
jgi:glycosyltransferase involved in cell wall biosynthesis